MLNIPIRVPNGCHRRTRVDVIAELHNLAGVESCTTRHPRAWKPLHHTRAHTHRARHATTNE